MAEIINIDITKHHLNNYLTIMSTTRTHYIITATDRHGRTARIDHHDSQQRDKRFIIGLYGLDQSDIESYTIRIAGTPLIYSRNKAIAV